MDYIEEWPLNGGFPVQPILFVMATTLPFSEKCFYLIPQTLLQRACCVFVTHVRLFLFQNNRATT